MTQLNEDTASSICRTRNFAIEFGCQLNISYHVFAMQTLSPAIKNVDLLSQLHLMHS